MVKLDLEKKLFLRKGKKVNPFIYKCLVNLVARPFLISPMNVHVNYKVDVKKIKGPFIVVSNHTSRCDWMYVSKALYPQNLNYVVSYTEFCRGHMHFVFDLLHMIPKKNFVPDQHFVKEMMQVLKDGGNVVIFPEGKSSISGTNQPIMNNTGRLFRYTKVPIYYTRISGGYMSNTQWNIANRPGKVVVEVGKLFDVEDFAKYTDEELDEIINDTLYNDDFVWNKTERVMYKGNDTVAVKLEEHLFYCPKCHQELTMIGEKNVIRCTNCGNGATINEYYDLIPLNEDCKIPKNLTIWYEIQRRHVYQQIKNNPDYRIEENVTLGMQPNDRYTVGKKITAYPVGKGKLVMTRDTFSFEGEKDGQPFSFSFKTNTMPTLLLETDSSYFGTFFEGRYYEFIPERKVTTKWVLSEEECHRITGGPWKNTLKHQQWLYKDMTDEELDEYFIK